MRYTYITYLTLAILLGVAITGKAQFIPLGPQITGPVSADLNETKTYTATNFTSNHSWSVIGGTIISYTSGSTATCQVKWTSVGQGSVRIFTETGLLPVTSYNVQVINNAPPPGIPTDPWIVSNPSCGPGVLGAGSPPNSDIRWYWQNSSTSQVTHYGYGQNFSPSSSGTYFLKARRTSDGVWSTSASAGQSITINPFPAIPPSPTVTYLYGGETSGLCANEAIFQKPNEPTDVTYYWQDGNEFGTSESNSDNTYNATVLGPYYLRAKNNVTNCWSASSREIFIVLDGPPKPADPVATELNCSLVRLTKPASSTTYWQGTDQYGTSQSNNNNNYDVSVSGRYYLRTYNHFSDCWSPVSFVDVNISQPDIPAPVVPNSLCGSSILTKPADTGGISYYWQTSDDGEETGSINNNLTYTVLEDDIIYLRAVSSNSCWSTARAINVDVLETPPNFNVGYVYTCDNVEVYIEEPYIGIKYDLYASSSSTPLPKMEGNNWNITNDGIYYARATFDPLLTICYTEQQVNISGLNTYTSVDAGPDITAFSMGNTFELTGMTPVGGEWSGTGVVNGTFFNPDQPAGLYEIEYSYTNDVGCVTTDTRNINLSETPVVSLDPGSFIFPGSRVTASVENFESIQWKNAGTSVAGETGTSFSIYEPGLYSVLITDLNNASVEVTFGIDWANEDHSINSVTVFNFLESGVSESFDLYEVTNQFPPNPIPKIQASTNHYDGLGRMIQSNQVGASPLGKDIISPQYYNIPGASTTNYLPYAKPRMGVYDPQALNTDQPSESSQLQFYETEHLIANSSFPYSKQVVELSPLGRVLEQGAPGQAWQPGEASVTFAYSHNSGNAVFMFDIDPSTDVLKITGYYGLKELTKTRTVDEEDHEIQEITDKLGRTVLKRVQASESGQPVQWADTYYVYDDFGNLRYVLPPKVVEDIGTPSFPYVPSPTLLAKWAFQYKYDGRKRMIEKKVPGAEPVKMIYDDRDRLVLTQDGEQRNSSKWLFTKYDALNRPIITGEKVLTATESELRDLLSGPNWLQNYAAYETLGGDKFGYTSNSLPKNITTDEMLTVTYYDDYTFPHASAYPFVSELGNTVAFDRVKGQVTGSKVKTLDGSNTWLESVVYYDNRYRVIQSQTQTLVGGVDRVTNRYDFVGRVLETKTTHQPINSERVNWTDLVNMTDNAGILTKTSGNNSWNGGAASVQQIPAGEDGSITFTAGVENKYRMIGLSTSNTNANWNTIGYAIFLRNNGTLHVREGGSGNRLSSAPVYNQGDQFKIERAGDKIIFWHNGVFLTELSATPQALLVDVSVHTSGHVLEDVYINSGGGEENDITITRTFDYDHAGRLIDTWHKINDEDSVLLAHNEYNELGELIEKNLHQLSTAGGLPDGQPGGAGGGQFAQSVDYRYNIRGWLTSINNAQLSNSTDNNDTGQATDFWGMELGYNQALSGVTAPAAYNGNISAVKWSDNLGQAQRAYAYQYDPMNRLVDADHKTMGQTNTDAFDVAIGTVANPGYDLNGNIESLTRKDESGVDMDDLSYTYQGNQLLSVIDDGIDTVGFRDGNDHIVNTNNDYRYDDNGNMVKDLNKGIDTIYYNHLSLPTRVERDANNYILYTYDAAGIKLRQEVYEAGALSKTTDYVGQFIYENDEIALIQHEEGRIVPNAATGAWDYEYYLKDHLGNTRVTFTTAPNTIEFTANYEESPAVPDDIGLFQNVDNTTITSNDLFDHTDESGSTYTHTQRLTGGLDSQVGSVIAIPVGIGDTLSAEVFAKYKDNTGNSNNAGAALAGLLINAFTGGIQYTNELGNQSINNNFGSGSLIGTTGFAPEDANAPMAFLNVMFLPEGETVSLEKDVSFAYDQIDGSAMQPNTSVKAAHDRMHIDGFVAPSQGYVLVYLSNESTVMTEVYFDDLKIIVNEHPVIQTDDYYPFGLAHGNGYQRGTAKENRFLYNGKEKIGDLGIDWYDYGARMYMSDVGRWGAVDPLAEDYYRWSTYNYVMGNPIRNVDPDGRSVIDKVSGFFQKVKNFVKGDGFKSNGQIKLENDRQKFQKANDLNETITEINELNGFNIPLTDVPRDPDAPTISQNNPDFFEEIEMKLDIKPEDGVGTVALKTAGDIVYGTANDPYSVIAGETLGGDDLSATEQESAIAGTVTMALSPLKPIKALKTQNMGQFTKGKTGLFKTFREAGNALLNSNAARRATNAATKGATKQGQRTTGVVDAVTKTKKNYDK